MSLARLLPCVCVPALAVAVGGCSDAVPPANEGAFTLVFQSMPTGGMPCTIGGHNAAVGYTDTKENRELKKDTIGGASIYCRVSGSGSLSADGAIQLQDRKLEFDIASLSLSSTEADPSEGAVAYTSKETVRTYTSPADAPCKFWFSKYQQGQTAAGRLWMDFTCPEIANVASNSSCAVSVATVAVQNCEQ